MRWQSGRRSSNIQDRRTSRAAVGGGLGVLVVALVVMLLGGDPRALLQLLGGDGGAPGVVSGPPPEEQAEAADFVSVVLASTEDVWGALFREAGQTYREPTLVLFSGRTTSACGMGTAATGPFYCPPSQEVHLDLTFFDDLAAMGGAGDFAAAYVIGHEIGHHVQNLLGTSDQVRRLQQGGSQADANALSVMLELQADCYAGVWAYHANRTARWMEAGDVDEGLAAAAAIGDDRLLRRAGRDVVPEAFTHGTSAQRQMWLRRGLESGDPEGCDTFGG
ncbi:MAG TPA: neutral zinc metallopeptidase [Longimicrobiales bacterium]|nr:neutral zinc metallopeptidase [Longimicrobiales bacterium]